MLVLPKGAIDVIPVKGVTAAVVLFDNGYGVVLSCEDEEYCGTIIAADTKKAVSNHAVGDYEAANRILEMAAKLAPGEIG